MIKWTKKVNKEQKCQGLNDSWVLSEMNQWNKKANPIPTHIGRKHWTHQNFEKQWSDFLWYVEFRFYAIKSKLFKAKNLESLNHKRTFRGAERRIFPHFIFVSIVSVEKVRAKANDNGTW